jgi:hypothetical protein
MQTYQTDSPGTTLLEVQMDVIAVPVNFAQKSRAALDTFTIFRVKL